MKKLLLLIIVFVSFNSFAKELSSKAYLDGETFECTDYKPYFSILEQGDVKMNSKYLTVIFTKTHIKLNTSKAYADGASNQTPSTFTLEKLTETVKKNIILISEPVTLTTLFDTATEGTQRLLVYLKNNKVVKIVVQEKPNLLGRKKTISSCVVK